MTQTQQSVQELVQKCISKGILVTPEMLEDKEALHSALNKPEPYSILVRESYDKKPQKRTVQDFVKYFNHRYRELRGLLKNRKEFENVVSISRLYGKSERENVSLIGMILDKKVTKNGHTILKLEDATGTIDVWIHANNKELSRVAKEIVMDEVIGVVGQTANKRVFANNIIFPDIPKTKVLKKGSREAYVVFVGDVEIGSNLFMKKEFEQLIDWLSGDLGNEEQREIAKKVGYVVFIGDLVHGAGIYPGQQEDSNIHDVKQQYAEFTKYMKRIPSHIQIVTITGNHDAGRLQEPQLPVYKDFAEELYALPNVKCLSNPALVNIDMTEDHPGFEVLLYHGYSLIYFTKEVQPIKDAGGLKATNEIMKLYLKKRHLAPTHGSNTYIPDAEEDPMVISTIPDFLITGHTHTVSHGTYNGVTLINAGCWNDVSDEQKKRGLEPEPARLPVVNLRTRELRIMNFYPEDT